MNTVKCSIYMYACEYIGIYLDMFLFFVCVCI